MTDPCFVNTDKGYVHLGGKVVDRVKALKNGIALEASHRDGVVVSENPESPFYQAAVFSQGTSVRDTAGKTLGYVQLVRFLAPEGDLAWVCGTRWHADGDGSWRLVAGTGKWQGIAGEFNWGGLLRRRADEQTMMRFEACWRVDPEKRRGKAFPQVGDLTDSDSGYSFHGPHVTTGSLTLADGSSLVLSDQSGVLLSENEDSPRHNATCFDRGTTIKSAEGGALGDVMLLEDTDAAGDVTWLYHEWWYGEGPGTYRFLMGTGRWKGIEGEGKTTGSVARRADDHYMPSWELSWRVDG